MLPAMIFFAIAAVLRCFMPRYTLLLPYAFAYVAMPLIIYYAAMPPLLLLLALCCCQAGEAATPRLCHYAAYAAA